MKPILINTYGSGGATKACLRLHNGLLRDGVSSKLLLKEPIHSDYVEIYAIEKHLINPNLNSKILAKIKSLFTNLLGLDIDKSKFQSQRNSNLEMFSFPESFCDIRKSKTYINSDIVNLHWVANFLDYSSFFKDNDRPIVWTLHDQNPFTGGEHYKEKFIDIDQNGEVINREITPLEKEVFKRNLEIKHKALKDFSNMHIVTLCSWMENEVKNSSLFNKFQNTIIPNGIDSQTFNQRDKIHSRELFNLPLDKTILLFVADSIENKRKGFPLLLKVVEEIKDEDILLISVGKPIKLFTQNKQVIQLGCIKDELLLSIIYSAADTLVSPALMDNLPNVVIESLLCGTPVIAFPVGGMTDLIQEGENGYLAESISKNSLYHAIEKFKENTSILDTSIIRKNAVKKYDVSVQIKNYQKLFNKILNK